MAEDEDIFSLSFMLFPILGRTNIISTWDFEARYVRAPLSRSILNETQTGFIDVILSRALLRGFITAVVGGIHKLYRHEPRAKPAVRSFGRS